MTVLIDKTGEEPIRSICAGHNNKPDALLEILHETQAEFGYLTDDALRTIAHALNISRAEIHGVVTFYHDYRRAPPAAHSIKLCRAEACQAVGSEALAAYAEGKFSIRTGECSDDGRVTIEAVYCLGNCALGPSAMIDGSLYGRVSNDRFDELCKKHIADREQAK